MTLKQLLPLLKSDWLIELIFNEETLARFHTGNTTIPQFFGNYIIGEIMPFCENNLKAIELTIKAIPAKEQSK